MLPRALLSSNVGLREVEVVPRYLGPRDAPWLRALLDVHAGYEGQPRSALRDRLADPLAVRAPRSSLRAARHVLEHATKLRTIQAVPAEAARAAVFRWAAVEPDRERTLALAAAELGVAADALEEVMYADLKSAERVGRVPEDLSPAILAQRTNLAIASGLIQRAQALRVRAFGNTRALVRHAQLAGLICNFAAVEGGVELEISGPFALFRHTLIYGKRLASLVPRVLWCDRFELEAKVALGIGPALLTFRLRTGDPLAVGRELDRYDSQVEARFARDFAQLGSEWDLVREPEPVPLDHGRVVFPDFALVHRFDPERRWLLEIVGFWTEGYLADKLARLRAARVDRLILCIDAARACGGDAMPEGAQVVRYRRRIDPREVLARVEAADGARVCPDPGRR